MGLTVVPPPSPAPEPRPPRASPQVQGSHFCAGHLAVLCAGSPPSLPSPATSHVSARLFQPRGRGAQPELAAFGGERAGPGGRRDVGPARPAGPWSWECPAGFRCPPWVLPVTTVGGPRAHPGGWTRGPLRGFLSGARWGRGLWAWGHPGAASSSWACSRAPGRACQGPARKGRVGWTKGYCGEISAGKDWGTRRTGCVGELWWKRFVVWGKVIPNSVQSEDCVTSQQLLHLRWLPKCPVLWAHCTRGVEEG